MHKNEAFMFRVLREPQEARTIFMFGCIEGNQGEAGVQQQKYSSIAEPQISSPTPTKELDDLPPINEIESKIIDSSSPLFKSFRLS